jgi:hypothetical protein
MSTSEPGDPLADDVELVIRRTGEIAVPITRVLRDVAELGRALPMHVLGTRLRASGRFAVFEPAPMYGDDAPPAPIDTAPLGQALVRGAAATPLVAARPTPTDPHARLGDALIELWGGVEEDPLRRAELLEGVRRAAEVSRTLAARESCAAAPPTTLPRPPRPRR